MGNEEAVQVAKKVTLQWQSRINAKYGADAALVYQALWALIQADKKRGIETTEVDIGVPGGVEDGAPEAGTPLWMTVKAAVDRIVRERNPDYIVLVGGPDLFPLCELENPVKGDEDPIVPSDLPYACSAPASVRISDYRGPTRMVSRLPDVPGASEPDVLVNAIKTATNLTSQPRSSSCLGISAAVWTGSTENTLDQIYGSAAGVYASPPDGPRWSDLQIGRPSHFTNLHGSPLTPEFFGEEDDEFPVALDAGLVEGRLRTGMIAAHEACYGAELFEPEEQLPMPLAYLNSGAAAYFGSTTTSYGMEVANSDADVICRIFMQKLLAGVPVARAGLEARQGFVRSEPQMTPIGLKTLGQFLVLGDASAQPVRASADEEEGSELSPLSERLRESGERLESVTSWPEPLEGESDSPVLATLREQVPLPGAELTVTSYAIRGGSGQPLSRGVEGSAGPATMHLLVQRLEQKGAPMPRVLATVAVEAGGRLLQVETAASR